MTNYQWPMDKPIEEWKEWVIKTTSLDIYCTPTWDLVDYLLDRLKLAEAERGEYKRRLEDAQWRLHD